MLRPTERKAPALQRLLGHDTLLTTEIYLNLSPQHVVEGFQQKW